MSFYVIGIGGSGAKCVEALIHLCAIGLVPEGELYTLFVDPDKANGNLERTEITLDHYAECNRLKLGSIDLCKTIITTAQPSVWSPFGNTPRPRLEEFFRYNKLKETNESGAHLFDVLYSPREKATLLSEGFRGHPSIGAAVMANTLTLGGDEPWKSFRHRVAQDAKSGPTPRIVLVGSIFGGTGASGIPTVARLIREELRTETTNFLLGAVLLLPYFSFDRVEEELAADSENFLLNTQAALKYYYGQDYLRVYDTVYLFGEQTLSPMARPSKGGREQKNEPHFIEFCAGLACIDFFEKDEVLRGYPMIARHNAASLEWEDLPYSGGCGRLKDKVEQLARFAFSYLCAYYPMLKDISDHGRDYRAPWYVNLLERYRIPLSIALDNELLSVRQYCEDFLLWLANIQTSVREPRVNLVNYHAFARRERVEQDEDEKMIGKERTMLLNPADFVKQDFAALLLPPRKAAPNDLSDFWNRMSDTAVHDKNASGVGRFCHALYSSARMR